LLPKNPKTPKNSLCANIIINAQTLRSIKYHSKEVRSG